MDEEMEATNEDQEMQKVEVPTRPDPKTCSHRPDPNIVFREKDGRVGSMCVNCGETVYRPPITPKNLKQLPSGQLVNENGPKIHMSKKERLRQREAIRKMAGNTPPGLGS
jgi:hypothetical protein